MPQATRSLLTVLAALPILVACGGGVADETTEPQSMSAEVTTRSALAAARPTAVVKRAVARPASSLQSQAQSQSQTTAPGTTFYVDSRVGNDSNNGRASSVGSAGVGPWKTLAKVGSSTLRPGDVVRLACGATWQETLKINASGDALSPITVGAFPAGCSNPPVIDGATAIAPNQWVRTTGNIYQVALQTEPVLLTSTGGHYTVAHHPNRGHDSSRPSSPYLRVATDSDATANNGRTVSTYLTTGSDLKLPAGITLTPGTALRIRTNSWTIDDVSISAVNGTRLTLSKPTSYFLAAGWGYFVHGQRWMLDSPGEWHYDKTTKILYAWMPNSQAPNVTVSAAQLAIGIDVRSQRYINIDGLQIKRVGTGVYMRGTTNVSVRNSSIEDTVSFGIDAMAGSVSVVEKNVITRTGDDAIVGVGDGTSDAKGMRVTNNTISQSGVQMNGEAMLSLPSRSRGAVRAGLSAQITGNSVIDSGYIGIWAMSKSFVRDNHVRGSCSVLDDCAGIYASVAGNGSRIISNVVEHSRGTLDGKPSTASYTQAQGIYLDEDASDVTVDGNTVLGTDNGIQVHVSSNNVIQNNTLYGNRNTQIWLQETRNRNRPSGDLYGNVVNGNQIVATLPTARGFFQQTTINNTLLFASFDGNRYFDRILQKIGSEQSPTLSQDYTMPIWKTALKPDGTPRNMDANGRAASEQLYASNLIGGASIVPNGSLTTNHAGWASWSPASPFGTLTREACTPGYCAKYVAGGSTGVLTSPNFSVRQGQWYRLSVDLATNVDGQKVYMLVRRGGGGANGYEPLSAANMTLTAGRNWQRFSLLFQATKTVNASDPTTLDLGARVDFDQIRPGNLLSVSNLEIVPVNQTDAPTRSDLLLNTSAAQIQVTCPVAATAPASCARYVRLKDDVPVTWPYVLPARSSAVVYTLDTGLVDADGDGIANSQDTCPGTLQGAVANAAGCALGQQP